MAVFKQYVYQLFAIFWCDRKEIIFIITKSVYKIVCLVDNSFSFVGIIDLSCFQQSVEFDLFNEITVPFFVDLIQYIIVIILFFPVKGNKAQRG